MCERHGQPDGKSGSGGAAGAGVAVVEQRSGAERRKGEWRMGWIWAGRLDKIGSGWARRARVDQDLSWNDTLTSTKARVVKILGFSLSNANFVMPKRDGLRYNDKRLNSPQFIGSIRISQHKETMRRRSIFPLMPLWPIHEY